MPINYVSTVFFQRKLLSLHIKAFKSIKPLWPFEVWRGLRYRTWTLNLSVLEEKNMNNLYVDFIRGLSPPFAIIQLSALFKLWILLWIVSSEMLFIYQNILQLLKEAICFSYLQNGIIFDKIRWLSCYVEVHLGAPAAQVLWSRLSHFSNGVCD